MSECKQARPDWLGLSLSGGGFRATLFHLGVVRLLYETGLLARVRFISGVSGGAILAAHLGLNWNHYTGETAGFESAAQEIVQFAQKDVRNRILRRWILGWLALWPRFVLNWSRVELLQREYRSLFGDRRLREFPNVYGSAGPRIILQCTNMTTGLPCSFGRSGLMLYHEQAEGRGLHLPKENESTVGGQDMPVARGVAASSAFPPMFPPLKVDSKLLNCPRKACPSAHYLTDGGVFDNLGMDRPLWWYTSKHQDSADSLEHFLISDAEGPFSPGVGKPWWFKFALPRNVRATEVLMKRVTSLNWKFLSSQNVCLVRIPVPSPGDGSTTGVESALAIRTDLDSFSDLEVSELIHSGFRAARCALTKEGWIDPGSSDNTSWRPVSEANLTKAQRDKKLERARFRRWLPLFFGFYDWAWWVIVVAICGGAILAWFRL